jgi:hypothetical protein
MLEGAPGGIVRELTSRWAEFGLFEKSPGDLVRKVALSALESGSSYWEDLALDWAEVLITVNLEGKDVWLKALAKANVKLSSQRGRHRAGKLLHRIKSFGDASNQVY